MASLLTLADFLVYKDLSGYASSAMVAFAAMSIMSSLSAKLCNTSGLSIATYS